MNPPPLPALNVRWLTDPAITDELLTVPASHDLQRLDYPLPPEPGHAWFERLSVAHGISLFQGVHRFLPEISGQRVSLGEFRFTFPEPTLVIQTIYGGNLCHQESYPRADLIYQPGYDCFRRAEMIQGQGLRTMARTLHRAPATISREWRRHAGPAATPGTSGYDAKRAGQEARRRCQPRRSPKLAVDGVLCGVVEHFLRAGWSPGQIAGARNMLWPDAPARRVAAETLDTCRYALPRGAWRQALIPGLGKGRSTRLPRARGTDRRGQLTAMLSIYVRPPAVEDRALSGHWEGDFIKGAGNRSAVGVLVERSSRLVLLAKMDDATAASALAGDTRQRNRIAAPLRQSLIYDQGQAMARHAELTAQTRVKVYCCDPHSPWQRGSGENTNGLLRQYLPKGTDMSVYSQEQRDAIAERLNQRPRAIRLNQRPRAIHGYFPPIGVYRAMMERLNQPTSH